MRVLVISAVIGVAVMLLAPGARGDVAASDTTAPGAGKGGQSSLRIRYIVTPQSWGHSPPDDRTTATGDSSAAVDSKIWRARGFTGCLRMCSVTNSL